MSNARDALAEAIALQRKLAASRLVRRDEIDAELAATTDEGRRAALAAERAAVEVELAAAMKEIKALQRLAQTQSAPVIPVTADDPLTPSPEMAALENVRAHLRDLEAQVKVADELRRVDEPDAPEDPPPPSGPRKRTM